MINLTHRTLTVILYSLIPLQVFSFDSKNVKIENIFYNSRKYSYTSPAWPQLHIWSRKGGSKESPKRCVPQKSYTHSNTQTINSFRWALLSQMQFTQQRQLLVFICVSVLCTKISLLHCVTNVTVDVIILQYCKQTVQKQRGKMVHSCFFLSTCSYMHTLRHRWPTCSKAHIGLDLGEICQQLYRSVSIFH